MKLMRVNETLSVSGQINEQDLDALAAEGIQLVVCNRPDGESAEQPEFSALQQAAERLGLEIIDMPFKSGEMQQEHIAAFTDIIKSDKKVHAYCRTGNRSFCLYAAVHASTEAPEAEIMAKAKEVGFDVTAVVSPYYSESKVNSQDNVVDLKTSAKPSYDVAILGAGSGGIAAAASILKRNSKLRVAVIDPATEHFYQPGWTMVGGGVFDAATTRRSMQSLIPRGVAWLQQSVVGFAPKDNEIELDNGDRVHYSQLIVAPGLTLDWAGVKGLAESLGKNGVTSNYSYQHAPYTWELVQKTKQGKAIFTQPPMPIKCAGAPQKALYLSCDHWRRVGVLKDIDVNFFNAGGVLFGVADYVPALQSYIDKYEAKVHYSHNLQEIDGENKVAHFKKAGGEGEDEIISQEFDMIHVCPPQRAPKFVADSELADAGGWLEVDQFSLQHKRFDNVWGLGDVMNTPNAKTMAAVRKQVPVVAQNLVDSLAGRDIHCAYDGYGSCPLTVERGKIVLAEFGYGGKIIPTFPTWMLQGKKPTRRAWALKKDILPGIYWGAMLKGREWLASSEELEKARA